MVTLKELITTFEECPEGAVFESGFKNPHSYRGSYYELSVEPAGKCTIDELLRTLKDAHGSTYYGYKGGEFRMDGTVEVYLSYAGSASRTRIVGWGLNGEEGYILLTEVDEY